MAVTIGINGFGRIGRLVFRQLLSDKNFQIAGINDAAKPNLLAYLLKYDTLGRTSPAETLKAGPDFITVRGKTVKVLGETDPARLPWKKFKVDLVLECSGLNGEQAAAHIGAGAKRVLIAGPGGEQVSTVVFGVNEKKIGPQDRIISAGSAAVNCLALLAKALHELAPIRSGIVTILHSSAGERPGQDGIPLGFRRARAGAFDIIPSPAGAVGDIGLLIPGLEGRIAGAAQRVPAASGSSVLLDAVVETGDLDAEILNRAMKAKSNRAFGYNGEEIISSDVTGCGYGALFDATQTLVLPLGDGLFQVHAVSWYGNESSYASQLARTIKYCAGLPPKGGSSKAPREEAGKPAPEKTAREDSSLLPRKPLINFHR
ncbi:MAG: glyceraldehyde-3-phosphate dehydrogenase [Treponema sp.]|jgi:glyceraldehyde 3-phosphate dehydrogenase|nr:glyceraldehyde-3-phosphate dehydrogenase [Treponema sp.]